MRSVRSYVRTHQQRIECTHAFWCLCMNACLHAHVYMYICTHLSVSNPPSPLSTPLSQTHTSTLSRRSSRDRPVPVPFPAFPAFPAASDCPTSFERLPGTPISTSTRPGKGLVLVSPSTQIKCVNALVKHEYWRQRPSKARVLANMCRARAYEDASRIA